MHTTWHARAGGQQTCSAACRRCASATAWSLNCRWIQMNTRKEGPGPSLTIRRAANVTKARVKTKFSLNFEIWIYSLRLPYIYLSRVFDTHTYSRHYQSSEIKVVCTDLSNGLADPSSNCFTRSKAQSYQDCNPMKHWSVITVVRLLNCLLDWSIGL